MRTKTRHFPINRVRALRRATIFRYLQNAQRAIVAIQMVAAGRNANLARHRIHAQGQRRRSLRRLRMGRPHPQTYLLLIILKRGSLPFEGGTSPAGTIYFNPQNALYTQVPLRAGSHAPPVTTSRRSCRPKINDSATCANDSMAGLKHLLPIREGRTTRDRAKDQTELTGGNRT